MISVYIGAPLPGIPHLPLLYPNLGIEKAGGALFKQGAFALFTGPFVRVVSRPEDAQFFLLPHNYFRIFPAHQKYIQEFSTRARVEGKPLILFVESDTSEQIHIPHAIIFRVSQYRSSRLPNEIIIPPYVEDLSLASPLVIREKSDKPVVGFCGFADYPTRIGALKAGIRHAVLDLKALGRPELRAHKKGVYFRKRALRTLRASSLITPLVVPRSFHSAHPATVRRDPEELRREYIQNLQESDIALTVRGDANASMRLFEAMSLGRATALLDTDTPLPLEDRVPYGDCMVRIDYRELAALPERIRAWYDRMGPEEWKNAQQRARELFTRYFRPDSFFRFVFSDAETVYSLVRRVSPRTVTR